MNTPWNRFWWLLSALWMGFWWYNASTIQVPPRGEFCCTSDLKPIKAPPGATDVKEWDGAALTDMHAQAMSNVRFNIALGCLGFVLWFLGRYIRHGFTFGFGRNNPVAEKGSREDPAK